MLVSKNVQLEFQVFVSAVCVFSFLFSFALSFSLFLFCIEKPDTNNFHHRTILHHSSFLHALKVVSVNLQMAHVLAFAPALAPALYLSHFLSVRQ